MILPVTLDRLPQTLGDLVASVRGWSPLGRAVAIDVEDSGDRRLIGARLRGVVRACAFDESQKPAELLVHLSDALRYDGHFRSEGMDLIVAAPTLRWHGANRLLLTWTAVRVVDAPSFADERYQRTIATGRMTLVC